MTGMMVSDMRRQARAMMAALPQWRTLLDQAYDLVADPVKLIESCRRLARRTADPTPSDGPPPLSRPAGRTEKFPYCTESGVQSSERCPEWVGNERLERPSLPGGRHNAASDARQSKNASQRPKGSCRTPADPHLRDSFGQSAQLGNRGWTNALRPGSHQPRRERPLLQRRPRSPALHLARDQSVPQQRSSRRRPPRLAAGR